MGSWILHNETLVTNHSWKYCWLFNCPFSNISPILFGFRVFFLGMGWRPSGLPIVRELFKERGFEGSRLQESRVSFLNATPTSGAKLTVKVGFTAAEVEDSTADSS